MAEVLSNIVAIERYKDKRGVDTCTVVNMFLYQ